MDSLAQRPRRTGPGGVDCRVPRPGADEPGEHDRNDSGGSRDDRISQARRLVARILAALTFAALRCRLGAARDQVRPRRRAGLAVRRVGRRVRQAREREARQQGEGRRVRVEPARRRQGTAPEAEARHRRHRAAVDRDVVRGGSLRRVRDAVPGQGPRAHGPHREGAVLVEARARGREEGPEGDRRVGERLPAHHELASARSTRRPTCRASSCACPKASGA